MVKSIASNDGMDEDEEDEEADETLLTTRCSTPPELCWVTGTRRKTMYIYFTPEALHKLHAVNDMGHRYNMLFKMVNECRVVRSILTSHGFKEQTSVTSLDFNIMWTGKHLKPDLIRTFNEHQRINHFPRSYELTRKDRLYKNIQRMQQQKGFKHFEFVPASFLLPLELNEFHSFFLKEKGTWIVKPVASSRGRGIYLATHPDQIPLDENVIVCRYITNPLLVNGYKFDCRLYVAVTSFDPLVVYLFEEGLTRFATVKFDKSAKHVANQCMHLTNYSVNKKSQTYVKNDDPHVEDYGSKWSLGALLRYMKDDGRDTTALMMRIEDVVIKTLISAEAHISMACKMFVPHRYNCFEVYGFDILIDDLMKPWVLEVNLSPSLACDSPLDYKVKSNMLCDLFNVVGVPILTQEHLRNKSTNNRKGPRPWSAGSNLSGAPPSRSGSRTAIANPTGMTNEELRLVRHHKEEIKRAGAFIRIFPSPDTWDLYAQFLETKTHFNLLLHQKLFPDRHSGSVTRTMSYAALVLRQRPTVANVSGHNQPRATDVGDAATQAIIKRSMKYERRLGSARRETRQRGAAASDSDEEDVVDSPTTTQTMSVPSSVPPIDVLEAAPLSARYDPVQLLNSGFTLSRIQARNAFAQYLEKVHTRMSDAYNDTSDATTEVQQMDLVIRFLKRAAANLSQPFKVVVPSRRLALSNRKIILAKQLVDFIHIYRRETELYTTLNCERGADETKYLNSSQFQQYIMCARESDLEKLLTVFTKINKSASIFLGSPEQSGNASNNKASSRPSSASTKVSTMKAGMRFDGDDDYLEPRSQLSATPDRRSATAGPGLNSLASAVTIYTAKPQLPSGSKSGHKSLSNSAYLKSPHKTSSTAYTDSVLNAALQRLYQRNNKSASLNRNRSSSMSSLNGSTANISEQSKPPERPSSNIRQRPSSVRSNSATYGPWNVKGAPAEETLPGQATPAATSASTMKAQLQRSQNLLEQTKARHHHLLNKYNQSQMGPNGGSTPSTRLASRSLYHSFDGRG